MKTELKYGVIIALASAVWLIAVDLAGLHDKYIEYLNTIMWLAYAIPIAGLFFAIKDKRDKDYKGYISYGQCVKSGIIISLIQGILGAIVQVVFILFINPNFSVAMTDYQRQQMLIKGVPEEQADIAINMMQFMFSPTMMAVFAFIGAIIGGLIITLILGAILKKEQPANVE